MIIPPENQSATECPMGDIRIGETFFYQDLFWLRISPKDLIGNTLIMLPSSSSRLATRLDGGGLIVISRNTRVVPYPNARVHAGPNPTY